MSYIGKGDNFISIVHPKDVAKCLRLALERDKDGDIFNVASFTCKIKEFFSILAKMMNVEEPSKHIPYSIAYIASIFSEIFSKKKLGYIPSFDLRKTAEDMVKWYLKNYS